MMKWQQLMDLLEKKRRALNGYNDLMGMFREVESIQLEIKEVEVMSSSLYFFIEINESLCNIHSLHNWFCTLCCSLVCDLKTTESIY